MTKIVDFDLYKAPPRWLFLRLQTDNGVVGWGEATVAGHVRTVSGAVTELLEQYILDSDAFRIEDHWQTMYKGGFHRGGPILMSAISGIDQALWDIKGKALDAPVYELLGGKVRDQIYTYRWVGGGSIDELCDQAESITDGNCSAIKMHATSKLKQIDKPEKITQAADRVRAVRETVGENIDVAVDCHGRASLSMAKQLIDSLEEYKPIFIEEPVLPEYSHRLPDLASNTSVPLATGERLYTRFAFQPIIENNGVDIVQPNISIAGGITEAQKIAAIADTHDIAFAPTHSDGPINFIACLHLCLTTPNAVVLDYGNENTTYSYFKDSPVEFPENSIGLKNRPGLGIDIDIDRIKEKSDGIIDWQNPTWRHDDNSVAEW